MGSDGQKAAGGEDDRGGGGGDGVGDGSVEDTGFGLGGSR